MLYSINNEKFIECNIKNVYPLYQLKVTEYDMNKVTKTTVNISLAVLLSIGLSGCNTNDENPAETPSANASPTASNLPRQPSGYIASYPETMELKDKKEFSENNYLAISPDRKLTINSYGLLDENKANMTANGDEVLHAVNYAFDLPKSGDPQASLRISVNGEVKPLGNELSDKGTLIISAPKDAEVLFRTELEGVFQTIDLKTAERQTKGVADAFYGKPVGVIENGTITAVTPVGDISPTLKYSVLEAVRSPYLEEESIGWADGGENTWVVLNMSPIEWELQGFDTLQGPGKATLIDEDGKKYSSKFLSEGNTTDNNKLAFNVPADKYKFTLLTEVEARFTAWGKSSGSTGTIENTDTKITFEPVSK